MTGPIWTEGEQGTTLWATNRLGFLTASRMADALDLKKNGGESEKRAKLKIELIAERLTGLPTPFCVDRRMQWGNDQEPYAKEAYEARKGDLITNCGFAHHGEIKWLGASPDGLVGNDGLIEIKCPESTTHIKRMLAGVVPEECKPQMLSQLAVTKRKWCDFVDYDPRFPEPYRLFIRRFQPAPEEIAAVETAAITFINETQELMDRLTQGEIEC